MFESEECNLVGGLAYLTTSGALIFEPLWQIYLPPHFSRRETPYSSIVAVLGFFGLINLKEVDRTILQVLYIRP